MTYNVFSGTLNPTHFTSGHIALDGDPAPQTEIMHSSPYFSARVYCGQTVAHVSLPTFNYPFLNASGTHKTGIETIKTGSRLSAVLLNYLEFLWLPAVWND